MATLASCSGDSRPPESLLDGSPVGTPPIELEGVVEPAVATKFRIISGSALESDPRVATCVRGRIRIEPVGVVVERVGVASETVTYRADAELHGCDNSAGSREGDRRWCGSSTGRLYGGRLRDPRLDIVGCESASGERMGFAWIEPARDTRYVAVEQPGYTEVYETAGGLAVRVATTTDIDLERSGARFRVSEHDAEGRLLKRYVLDAVVAG